MELAGETEWVEGLGYDGEDESLYIRNKVHTCTRLQLFACTVPDYNQTYN